MFVVSTLSRENYDLYAYRTIPTWLKYFPKDATFFLYTDFELPIKDSRIKYFQDSNQKKEFLNRNSNRIFPTKAKSYQTKWNTYCHKVFAQCESADILNDSIMIFIDADVALLKEVSESTVKGFLRDSFCSYVSRSNITTETGLIFYDLSLDQEKHFFKEFLNVYLTDKIFNFSQWDDAYIFDEVRKSSSLKFTSMSGKYEDFVDPIAVGPLGEYFDHWLSKKSKRQGFSKHRKFREKI